MALTILTYQFHVLQAVRLLCINSPEKLRDLLPQMFNYAQGGADQRDAMQCLITLAVPSMSPHQRKHLLHEVGIENATNIPDTPEPIT